MNQSGQFANHLPKCGVIIPVCNSAARLEELLKRIAKIEKQISEWQISVLLVDDGSRPPLPVFNENGLTVATVRHEENRGKGAALKTGFAHFLKEENVQLVITIDADLQHPPEYLPQFLQVFQQGGGDVIVGCRKRDPKQMPFHRILSNALTSWIISLMIRQNVKDSQCGFRLYSRRVLESIHLKENRFHLESEFLIRSGWKKFKIGFVFIPTIYNDAPSAIRHLPDTLNFISLIWKLTLEKIKGHV